MATQKVNIDIQTKGAKKSKDELAGLTGAINKVGKAAGIASAAYFGAKGLISAFSSVIEASARQEQAEKALEVALGRTSKSLLDQASALQQVTTAGDEAIIEQQAFLASLKFTEDQIKTIIPVALDLSAATGISLESAVRNTSKTFSGLAGELGELVPQLRDLTTEEMKAGEAVKVLGELFEGQASKQAETLAGSLVQMSNAVGDAGEAIGSLLAPSVIKVAGGIKFLAEGVGDVIERFKDFGEEVDGVLIDGKTTEIEKFKQSIKGLSQEELLNLNTQLMETQKAFELQIDSNLTKNITKDFQVVGEETLSVADKTNLLIEAYNLLEEVQNKNKERIKELGSEIQITNELRTTENELMTQSIDTNSIVVDSLDSVKNKTTETSNAFSNFNENLDAAIASSIASASAINSTKNALLAAENAAKKAAISFVSGEIQKAVASFIFKTMSQSLLPPMISGPLAVAAGAAFGSVMSSAIARNFATGGDFVTSGPEMIMVGDNPGGRERVQVTPLSSPNINGPQGGITVNISAPLVDQSVVESIIPAINSAVRENRAVLSASSIG
tara:strand:- start:41 stop:1720 length:1680 start_codon:yes stop_codon:yes gene_type:complete